MSKPAKPAAPATDAPPPKSKKMLIIIIAAAVLLLGGGVAAYILLKPHPPKHDDEAAVEETHAEVPPKFVELGTFTANLIHEDGDRYLQIAISLKLTKPELEEKIKANNPEVLHRVNMLLQSKRPSELATVEGKEKLANDIKAQVEYILGLRKTAPAIGPSQHAAASNVTTAEGSGEHAPQAQTEASDAAETRKSKSGIAEVLFTSFIIQ
ncbi:MAG TPA: flagellar basal body-associated FliL family protein [Gallionella sp.]|nr:flagellar basal body-associated FliL family protein [Gallionella sp.]